jgi:hypothetical protein
MRIVAVALVLSASIVSSAAQTAQSEAEKRRQHVPYVRAATFCIANFVRQDEQFSNAVVADYFTPLIGRAWPNCQPQLSTMVQMHDQIYGGGGSDFMNGAYWNDLDRAVRQRLAPDIQATRDAAQKAEAQRQAEEEKAENERKAAEERARAERIEAEAKAKVALEEKLAVLQKASELVRDRLMNCVGREGSPMVLTNDSAEAVAKASMFFCQNEVDAFDRSLFELSEAEHGPSANPDATRQVFEKVVLDAITAYVIKARGEMIRKNLQSPSAPPAAQPLGPPT